MLALDRKVNAMIRTEIPSKKDIALKSGIYQIQHMESGKKYIGSAVDIKARWHGHRSQLRRGLHNNDKLQNAWNKYGEDAFDFSTLIICDKKDLIMYEQKVIDVYDVVCGGYNICPVAGNTLGVIPSEESRGKMRHAQLGRKHPEEVKKKISESHKGRKRTAEHVKNMADAKRGMKNKPATEERKKKIGLTHKGKITSEETKQKISISLTGRKLAPFSFERKKRMSEGAKRRWANAKNEQRL